MEMYRCINCMQQLGKNEAVCHCCGYRMADYKQPSNALKQETILCGRYLVGRVLGQGGFGITYVGYDLKLECKVAIKEYYPGSHASRQNATSNELQWSFNDARRRSWQGEIEHFLAEAKKMAKLDALPGIVRVRDSFQENQTAYIIMDFAEGVTLKDYLKRHGRQSYPAAVELLLPMIDNLQAMHERGLVHRDISPDNLMVQEKGRELKLSLLDFGASIDISMEHSGKSEHVVKKGYSAPEQYMESGEIGSWTDVYAMAAVLYYCLTLQELPEAMERVMKPGALPLNGVKSKKAQNVLARALELETDKRIRTMGDFKDALVRTLPGKRALLAKISVAILAAAAVAGGVCLYVFRPFAPEVTALGTSNSNLCQGANYALKSKEYVYFGDEDWNLYVCPYNEEDGTFYIDDSEVVDSEEGFINIGREKVYFIHDNNGNSKEPDSIMEMNFDGSGVREIRSDEGYIYLQYAEFSNGEEWLYYMKEQDDESYLRDIYRYDLKKGKEELICENVYWFCMDGKYLYFSTFKNNDVTDGVYLNRAYLDGSRAKVINEKDQLAYGFIEDGTAYLYSLSKERILTNRLTDDAWENTLGDNSKDIFDGVCVYGDGYLYYSAPDSGEIRKIAADGTEDRELVIYRGKKEVLMINYSRNNVWFITGEYDEEGNGKLGEAYLISSEQEYSENEPLRIGE